MNMPTMNNWDMNQALSPYLPPDMNTIASGSMISSYNQSAQNRNAGSNSQNYDFGMNNGPGSNEYAGNGPLSHLNDSVNSLDPLNAMEKSLNEQVSNVNQSFPLFYYSLLTNFPTDYLTKIFSLFCKNSTTFMKFFKALEDV